MDAFDADVLIYAAAPGHALGTGVRTLFDAAVRGPVGMGSVLLLPELLSKPAREGRTEEVAALRGLLGRLELHETTRATAALAAGLGAEYGLRAADAVHLATAIERGASRFVTNNRRDFGQSFEEIEVAFPDDL